jgi:Protein of unknown function (DUF732)
VPMPTVGTPIHIVPSLPIRSRAQRTALYVATGVVALLAWVGIFLLFFGHRGAAATSPWPNTLSVPQQTALSKLPTGTTDPAKRSAALATFDKAIGVDVSADEGAQAATTACGLLQAKQSPTELVDAAASGGALSPQVARAYLLGATRLYCPGNAAVFADPTPRH